VGIIKISHAFTLTTRVDNNQCVKDNKIKLISNEMMNKLQIESFN